MTGYTFKAPTRPVNKVYLHCSDSDRPEDDKASVINDWHIKRSFDGIGYHFYLRKSGQLEMGRKLERTPAAQQGHNTGSIAICLGGRDKFTEQQFATLRDLCRQIHEELPLATFHGHREVSNKTCPRFAYSLVLGLNDKGQLV